jgi:hypothetical protein
MKCHIPSCGISLVIAAKLRAESKTLQTTYLFYIPQKLKAAGNILDLLLL